MDVSEESLWKYPLYEYCQNGNLWAVNRILSTPEGKAKMESEIDKVRYCDGLMHGITMKVALLSPFVWPSSPQQGVLPPSTQSFHYFACISSPWSSATPPLPLESNGGFIVS